ncbi:hypothetical protein FRB94_006128 [Tulasnella sp. JGI-2019a]|nr:hypothetical protein FRB94_006128 [Tulasnella sp. JGI-2019a]
MELTLTELPQSVLSPHTRHTLEIFLTGRLSLKPSVHLTTSTCDRMWDPKSARRSTNAQVMLKDTAIDIL